MTTIVNPDTEPQILQTFALLQIAAEAMFEQEHARPAAVPGSGALTDRTFGKDGAVLIQGNDHASKMTAAQAAQFASEWSVVSHQPNTATGFSATLFRCLVDDPSRGMTVGQYVLCFRSTEFVDDNARDGKATDEMEISQGGWAFGQIADMQLWWAQVKPQLSGAKVDVTGYSFGAPLATAFFELNKLSVGNVRIAKGANAHVDDQLEERVNRSHSLELPSLASARLISSNDAEYRHVA